MKIVPSLHPFGEICREIDRFPNATVAEYGQIRLEEEGSPEIVMQKIKAEVFARGPVVAAINGVVLHNYRGGIIANSTASRNTTHAVSIVGWGVDNDDANNTPYYVVRNSWGTYWGEVRWKR